MSSLWKRIRDYCPSMLWHWRPPAPHPADSGGFRPRREPRVSKQDACAFALTHVSTGAEIICEEGAGTTVNISPSGVQLLLGVAPPCGQLLEVRVGSSVQQSGSLLAVRWTKPVRADLQDQLHFVGCRLTFGPMRSWAV